MKEEKWKAAEDKEASLVASAGGAACKSRCKSPSKSARAVYDNAVFTADVHVEPVHLLMLSNFCSDHDTEAKM